MLSGPCEAKIFERRLCHRRNEFFHASLSVRLSVCLYFCGTEMKSDKCLYLSRRIASIRVAVGVPFLQDYLELPLDRLDRVEHIH